MKGWAYGPAPQDPPGPISSGSPIMTRPCAADLVRPALDRFGVCLAVAQARRDPSAFAARCLTDPGSRPLDPSPIHCRL